MRQQILALSAATLAVVLFSQPVIAGARSMAKASGAKANVSCNGGGCVTKYYNKAGKLTKTTKGPGGTYNFKKIVFRLRKSGYN